MREFVGEVVRLALLAVAVVVAPASLPAQVSVLTHHGDNARTGANLNESILTVSNVNSEKFGKLATRYVDGNIYTQPLVAAGVRAIHRSGPANLVIVATEQNNVYAFDADDVNPNSTNALVWKTGPSTLGRSVPTETLLADIAKGVCADLTPDVGITSTPAIQITKHGKLREGLVFVVAKSKTGGAYHYTLFALRLADGVVMGREEIRGEVPGRGFASVKGKIRFDPRLQLNRPGLLLVGNKLYVAFGGHCDMGDYHGWLFTYDVSNPKAMKRSGILNTTPNGPEPGAPKTEFMEGGAGIWMSGEGPSADESGSVYFSTGNGTNNRSTDLGDSVVRVTHNGVALKVEDWFVPEEEQILKDYDIDLGSTGAVLLPDSHLLITASKEGRMYLLDRDNLGKTAPPVAFFQVTHEPATPNALYSIHGTPALWPRGDEMFVYVSGSEDPVRQFRMVRDAAAGGWKFDPPYRPFQRSSVTAPYPNAPQGLFGLFVREHEWMPGGFLTVSSNGADGKSGILWVTMPFTGNAAHKEVRGQLRALDASDVSKPELWNSECTGDENDQLGYFAKFVPPTVANGKVYVSAFQHEPSADEFDTTGTSQPAPVAKQSALVIYGLR